MQVALTSNTVVIRTPEQVEAKLKQDQLKRQEQRQAEVEQEKQRILSKYSQWQTHFGKDMEFAIEQLYKSPTPQIIRVYGKIPQCKKCSGRWNCDPDNYGDLCRGHVWGLEYEDSEVCTAFGHNSYQFQACNSMVSYQATAKACVKQGYLLFFKPAKNDTGRCHYILCRIGDFKHQVIGEIRQDLLQEACEAMNLDSETRNEIIKFKTSCDDVVKAQRYVQEQSATKQGQACCCVM